MNSKTPDPHVIEEADHDLATHSGVIRVSTDPVHAVVDVEFNPAVLSDSDVRSLLKEHISQVESSIRKHTFRLEGNACEACAQKLEKKVGKIPGVRRATATYLGQGALRHLRLRHRTGRQRRRRREENRSRHQAARAPRHRQPLALAEDPRRRAQRGDLLRPRPRLPHRRPHRRENGRDSA